MLNTFLKTTLNGKRWKAFRIPCMGNFMFSVVLMTLNPLKRVDRLEPGKETKFSSLGLTRIS